MNNPGIYYSKNANRYALISIIQHKAYYVSADSLLASSNGWRLKRIYHNDWTFICFQDELNDNYPELLI